MENAPLHEAVSHPSGGAGWAARRTALVSRGAASDLVGGPRVALAHGWQDTYGTGCDLQGEKLPLLRSPPTSPPPHAGSLHTQRSVPALHACGVMPCALQGPGEAGRLIAYRHVSLSASTIPRQLCAPWASLSVVLATCLQTQHWALGRLTSSVSNAVTCVRVHVNT